MNVSAVEQQHQTPVAKLFRPDRVWFEDPFRFVPWFLVGMYSVWVRATYRFASIGKDVRFHYSWDFRRYLAHRISLGNRVDIQKDVHLGVSCLDREQKGEPAIVIEDNCVITRRAQISAKNRVHIERNVIVSAAALIMDHNHEYEDIVTPIKDQGITAGGTIRIGEGSWIGHGAAIVCNSGELVLGRNCVVAANALVTRSFPPYSVIVGNPARLGRQYDPVKECWVPPLNDRSPAPAAPAKQAEPEKIASR